MIRQRKNIRLKGYDYSKPGLYFITICCQGREMLFGQIENGNTTLYMKILKPTSTITRIETNEMQKFNSTTKKHLHLCSGNYLQRRKKS